MAFFSLVELHFMLAVSALFLCKAFLLMFTRNAHKPVAAAIFG